MNFEKALTMLKNNKKMQRTAWVQEEKHIQLLVWDSYGDDHSYGSIMIFVVDGECFQDIHLSNSDILAMDWEEFDKRVEYEDKYEINDDDDVNLFEALVR